MSIRDCGIGVVRSTLSLMLMLVWMVSALEASAQGASPYEDMQFDPFQRELYRVGRERPHSTMRFHKMDDIRRVVDPDSVIYMGVTRRVKTRWGLFNDFMNDNFLHWSGDSGLVQVSINPMLDLEVGQDRTYKESSGTWVNSRGVYIDGNLGKNFWFYADFSENQAIYAQYYNNLLDSLKVVPGQAGFGHPYKGDPYDFRVANGYVAFNAGKWIDFVVGKTKNFVGDGYRSLLLGDAAPTVPQFRMNVTFLGVKYTMMVAQLRATGNKVSNNGQKTKYSFSHFLDWNMGRRFTLGVFENVTMATWRKTGETRGIDWEYLNPFVVFRPGEYNAGSPDKMLVGLTGKFIFTDRWTMYSQIMFNEFRIKELLSDKGYWSNKYGTQIGLRGRDIFGIMGLDMLAEYNMVRPFCYTQYDGMATYTHHAQSMGHPLGANLREGIGILTYKHGRLMARAQMNIAQYGDEIPKDTVSYGHDPNIASTKRKSQYGVEVLQGLKTTLHYADISASFLINPRSMMNFTAGVRVRKRESEQTKEESTHIYAALRWSIKGHYYDY